MRKYSLAGIVLTAGVCITGLSGCNRHATTATNVSTVPRSNGNLTNGTGKKSESRNSNISYSSYVNKTLGFSAKYPSTWTEIPGSPTGIGHSFETPSNVKSFNNGLGNDTLKSNVVLSAYGTPVSKYKDFSQLKSQVRKYVMSIKGKKSVLSTTYGAVPHKWVWFTFTQKIGHNAVHINKTYQTLQTVQIIAITFPSNETNKYMPIWDYVSTHFVPGEKKG